MPSLRSKILKVLALAFYLVLDDVHHADCMTYPSQSHSLDGYTGIEVTVLPVLEFRLLPLFFCLPIIHSKLESGWCLLCVSTSFTPTFGCQHLSKMLNRVKILHIDFCIAGTRSR